MAINEKQKWPTNKAKYDKNHTKIFGMTCKSCAFYEKDYINDDGDLVDGWGCCCPRKCPYERNKK